jgi:CRP/FNR family cyclic AMP-dependent transcriptional regulator
MGRDDDTVLARLGDISMFAPCTKKELQQIARLTTKLNVDSGRVLTKEGERGSEFAIVLDGTASVTQHGKVVGTLTAGGHYGEMSLIDDGPRTATVTATSPMTLAVVAPNEFGQLLEDVPALARAIMRGLARRIRELDKAEVI